MDFDNFDKKMIEMSGFIENGKQYDIEVKVPEDKRSVAFGIVKDEYGDPICDAVVKLIEVEKKLGKDIRKPVSHTFTNENGEFVFGPLCPDKYYDLQIWVNRVKHIKICHVAKPKKQTCLKGEKRTIEDTVDLKFKIKELYNQMKNVLLDREKKIIELRYGLDGKKPKTQKEIAKMLNISRSYVSRIETKAIGKLNKAIEQ